MNEKNTHTDISRLEMKNKSSSCLIAPFSVCMSRSVDYVDLYGFGWLFIVYCFHRLRCSRIRLLLSFVFSTHFQ